MIPQLELIASHPNGGEDEVFLLSEKRIAFGTGPDCDFQLKADELRGEHGVIVYDDRGGEHFLKLSAWSPPMMVNGALVSSVKLTPGIELDLGPVTLRCRKVEPRGSNEEEAASDLNWRRASSKVQLEKTPDGKTKAVHLRAPSKKSDNQNRVVSEEEEKPNEELKPEEPKTATAKVKIAASSVADQVRRNEDLEGLMHSSKKVAGDDLRTIQRKCDAAKIYLEETQRVTASLEKKAEEFKHTVEKREAELIAINQELERARRFRKEQLAKTEAAKRLAAQTEKESAAVSRALEQGTARIEETVEMWAEAEASFNSVQEDLKLLEKALNKKSSKLGEIDEEILLKKRTLAELSDANHEAEFWREARRAANKVAERRMATLLAESKYPEEEEPEAKEDAWPDALTSAPDPEAYDEEEEFPEEEEEWIEEPVNEEDQFKSLMATLREARERVGRLEEEYGE